MATETAPKSPRARLHALDGLRGLAALVVFAHHALVLLYGPLAGVNEHHWVARPLLVQRALQVAPVAWVFNGAFAVSFFFVLSGFVLTRAMGAAPTPARVAALVTTRFLRLFPLVAIGTAFGWLTFEAGRQHLDGLLLLTGNDSSAYIHADLLARHGFKEALSELFATIWRGTQADRLLDPPLWSIGVELKGSLLVYFLAGAFVDTPNRRACYAAGIGVGLSMMGPDALSFLLGMALAERSRLHGERLLGLGPVPLTALAGLALVWASIHPWDRSLWLPLPVQIPGVVDTCISTAMAAALMAAGVQLAPLRWLLETRLVQWLGHASYGLYVVHVPLLYLGCTPLLRLAHRFCPPHTASSFVCGTLLLASLGLGAALITYVDTPLAARSKAWAHRWLSNAP